MAKKDCEKNEVCKELSDEVLEQVTGGATITMNGNEVISGTPEEIIDFLKNWGITIDISPDEKDAFFEAITK